MSSKSPLDEGNWAVTGITEKMRDSFEVTGLFKLENNCKVFHQDMKRFNPKSRKYETAVTDEDIVIKTNSGRYVGWVSVKTTTEESFTNPRYTSALIGDIESLQWRNPPIAVIIAYKKKQKDGKLINIAKGALIDPKLSNLRVMNISYDSRKGRKGKPAMAIDKDQLEDLVFVLEKTLGRAKQIEAQTRD